MTKRLSTAPGSQRFAIGASLGLYLGSLFLAPRLGPLALGMMAALAATLFAWVRLSPAHPSAPVLARLFWIPLHLALLATGGLASPLLPLVVPWLALSPAVPSRRGRAFVAGVAAVLIAGDVWQHGVGATRWIEAVLLAAAGGLLVESYAHARRQAAIKADTLDRILEEAEVGRRGRALSEAVHRLDVLDEALDRVARTLGAARVVLWEIDVERDRAIPKRASGGPMPAPVPLAGDPLRWAWEERLPLRLEAGARWAGEYRKACIVPLEIPAPSAPLLTLAFADGVEFPSPDALADAENQIRTLLLMQMQEAAAVSTRERFLELMSILGRLTREPKTDSFANALAVSAMELGEATGAAVALWGEEGGRVLAVVGEDGGPAVGDEFGPLESEMALAARGEGTLLRENRRGEGGALAVAVPGERWIAEPRALAVIPLRDHEQGVIAVLAVWSSRYDEIRPEVVEALELLAPYAALQLFYALTYGSLREHAERDPLTGLHNRRVFEARLAAAESHFLRYRRPVALAILDIDHFKRVNDTYGHEAGDEVLRAVAASLRASLRDTDMAARLGGEEFVVLQPETTLAGAVDAAERLRRQIEEQVIEWRGERIPIRISVGVSAAPECVESVHDLVESADAALYASKNAGRNRVTAAPTALDPGPPSA